MATMRRPPERLAYGASGTVLTFLEKHEHLPSRELIPKLNGLIVQVLTETSDGGLQTMLGMILEYQLSLFPPFILVLLYNAMLSLLFLWTHRYPFR